MEPDRAQQPQGGTMKLLLQDEMYFSYGQFFIYDLGQRSFACDWTEEHVRQGFARRHGTVAAGTLYSFGEANLTVCQGAPVSIEGYDRVIAVPLEVFGGGVNIVCVEDWPAERRVALENGAYRVVIAQRDAGSDPDNEEYREEISVFLELLTEPMKHSEILVRDGGLDPPSRLLEYAQEPEV